MTQNRLLRFTGTPGIYIVSTCLILVVVLCWSSFLINVCISIENRPILKCLSIGTLKTIDIPYIPNKKNHVLGIQAFKRIVIGLECAQILGHLKIINFPFGTKLMENLLFLDVPILKQFTVLPFPFSIAI